MVNNPPCGQLYRENEVSRPPFAPENLLSRDGFSRPVLPQPARSPHPGGLNLVRERVANGTKEHFKLKISGRL